MLRKSRYRDQSNCNDPVLNCYFLMKLINPQLISLRTFVRIKWWVFIFELAPIRQLGL